MALRLQSLRHALPEVSIILVNWRSKDYVRECLRSLEEERQRDSYEVLVVDNDSEDGCGTMLEEEFPQVRYIESTANLGFARANNLAAAKSSGRYILFSIQTLRSEPARLKPLRLRSKRIQTQAWWAPGC